MIYSADSQEANRAEALGAAGSREHSGHQLSHIEAVDLPRKNQVGENARWAPPCSGGRNRPPVSEEVESRRHRIEARQPAEDQRTKPIDRARGSHEIQRTVGSSHSGHRRAAHYLHHHGGCGEGAAPKAWRARRGADQINRSDDPSGMTYFAKITVLASILALLSAVVCAPGQEISIAAAADLKFAMEELSEQFQKQTGTRVNATYGSSGNFFSQMQNGAPFDLFFSADIEYPRRLEATRLAEPGTLYEYAVGRIVIWTPLDAKMDVTKQGWKALLDASVKKIAIANPEHAPYGRAAVAALQKAGIYESVKNKLVYGENISQAAQFIQSGNAQAGIVALSLAISPAMKTGKRWNVPPDRYPSIEQAVVILKSSPNKQAAVSFLTFLKSPPARATFERYGYAATSASIAAGQKP